MKTKRRYSPRDPAPPEFYQCSCHGLVFHTLDAFDEHRGLVPSSEPDPVIEHLKASEPSISPASPRKTAPRIFAPDALDLTRLRR